MPLLTPTADRCPACRCLPGHHHDWCPDLGPVLDSEKGKHCPVSLRRGDIVVIEAGAYTGAFLDWVERDRLGWHVCVTSTKTHVRTRRVLFYRRPYGD